jgi:hypothetical protein
MGAMSPEQIAEILRENANLKDQLRILRDENDDLKRQLAWLKRLSHPTPGNSNLS